jgi:isoleucyl-tRNA synthetase
MSSKQPIEFTQEMFKNLRSCIDDAIYKIQGNNIKDVPATDFLKDDDWNSIDTLNVYFDSIADIITSTYKDPNRQQAQLILRNSFEALVETSKTRAPHLTEKYESVIRPRLYDSKHLSDLITYVNQAKQKIEGDNSFDIPSEGRFKDEDLTPLDQLAVSMDSIAEVLKTKYMTPEKHNLQLQLRQECDQLIESAKVHTPRVAPDYAQRMGLKE